MSTPWLVFRRTALLLLVEVIGWLLLTLTTDPAGGANIGAGLAIFVGYVLVAACLGYVDGRRLDTGRAMLVWVLTGAVFGVLSLVVLRLLEAGSGGWSWPVFLADLLVLAPFTAALVAVPGVVGVLVAAAGRPRPGREGFILDDDADSA